MNLYEASHKGLNRFCSALCRNYEEARDLAGDTLLTALEHFDKLRSEEHFRSYLFGIAVNLRRQRSRRNKFKGVFNLLLHSERPDENARIHFGAEMYMVNKLLSRLPDAQKEAFILFELADVSLKDIAVIQACGENTVKTRLSRAREKLAGELKREEQLVTGELKKTNLNYSLNKGDHG